MRVRPGHIDPSWPSGTFSSRCDYCGCFAMRHELRRDESGFLACAADATGRDSVQLNRLNAQAAASIRGIKYPGRYLGGSNPRDDTLPVIHRTTAADIRRYQNTDVVPPALAVKNTASPFLGTSTLLTLPVPWPIGHQAGQLGILVLHTHNHAVATPGGWTPIGSVGIGTPDTDFSAIGLQVFWRIAVSSAEPSALVVRSGEMVAGRIGTISGFLVPSHVSPLSPVVVAATVTGSNAAATSFSYPTVTAAEPGVLFCYVASTAQSNTMGAANRTPAPTGLGTMVAGVVNGDANGIDGVSSRGGSSALYALGLPGTPTAASFSQTINSSVSAFVQFQVRRAQ